MKYIIMVKIWIRTNYGFSDYTYEEYDGVEYESEEEAKKEAQRQFLSDYYIAEK